MAFKSLQEIKNNIKTTSNTSNAFNADNLSTGQANQLGFQTQGTKNANDQKKQQSLLQQQLNKDFNRQQEKIKDLQKQKQEKELDESNSRDMNIVEDALVGLNKVGESISDLSGFSENWADFKQNISEGNIGKAAAQLPKTALSFAASVPLGMASIPFTSPAGIAETLTGNRYTEAKDGRVSNEKLNAEERVAEGLSTAIDLAGIPFGGTGRLVGGAVTLGRTAMRDTAGQAVRQAAGRAVRNEALESAEQAAARTATQAAANRAATNNALQGAMRVFDNNLENASFGTQLGFDMAEEGGEEFVQGLTDAVRGNESEGTGGLKELKKGSTWTSALENAALGAAGGALFSGVGHGMRAMADIINEEDNTRERRSVGANVREEREANGTTDEQFTAAAPMTPRETNVIADDNERLTSVAEEISADQINKTARDEGNFSTSGTVVSDQSLAVDEVNIGGAGVLKLFSQQAGEGSREAQAQERFLEALHLDANTGAFHPRAQQLGANMNYDEFMNALSTASVNSGVASAVIQTLNAQIQAVNEDPNLDDIYLVINKQPGLDKQSVAVRLTALTDPRDTNYKMIVNPMLANDVTADYDGDIMSILADAQEIETAIRNNYFLSYNATSSNPAAAPGWNLDYAESGNLGYNPDQPTLYTRNNVWQQRIANAFEALLQANNIQLAQQRALGLAAIFTQITNGRLNENFANDQMFRTDEGLRNMIRIIASQRNYNQQIGQFFASLNEYLYASHPARAGQNHNRANAVLHSRTIANTIQQIALATEDIQSMNSTVSVADKMIEDNLLQNEREIADIKPIKRGVSNDPSLATSQVENKNVTRENAPIGEKQSIYFRKKFSNITQASYDSNFFEHSGVTFGKLDSSMLNVIITFALGKKRVGEDVEDLLISAIRYEVQAHMEERFGEPISNTEELNNFVDSFVEVYNKTVDRFNEAIEETKNLGQLKKISKIEISKNDSVYNKLKNDAVLDKIYDTYKETTIRKFFSIDQSGYLGNNTFEQVVGLLEHFDHQVHTDGWLYDFNIVDQELSDFIPTFLKDVYKRKVRKEEKAYEDFGEWLASTKDFKFATRTQDARDKYNRYQESINDPNCSEGERQKRATEYQIALDDFTGLFDRILSVLDKSVVKFFGLFYTQDILLNPDELVGMLLSGNKDTIYSGLIGAYVTYNLRRANWLKDTFVSCLADGNRADAAMFFAALHNELIMVSQISPFYKSLCSYLDVCLFEYRDAIANNTKTQQRAIEDLERQWMLANGLCSSTVSLNQKKELIQKRLLDKKNMDYFYSNILKTPESALTESSISTKLRSAKRHIDLKSNKVEGIKKTWKTAIDGFNSVKDFIEALKANALEDEIKNKSNAMAVDAYGTAVTFDKAQKDKAQVPQSTNLAYDEMNAQSRGYATTFEEKMSTEVDRTSKTENTFLQDEQTIIRMIFEPDAEEACIAYADGVEVRDFTSFWHMVTGREGITSLNDLTRNDLMKLVDLFPYLPQIFYPKSLGYKLTGENEATVSLYTSNKSFIEALDKIKDRTAGQDNEAKKKRIRNSVKRDLVSRQSFRKLVIGKTWSKLLGKQKIPNISKVSYEEFRPVFEETENEIIDLLLQQLAYYSAENNIGIDDYATSNILTTDALMEDFTSLVSPLISLQKMLLNPQETSLLDSGQKVLIERAYQNAEEEVIRNHIFSSLAATIVENLNIGGPQKRSLDSSLQNSVYSVTEEQRNQVLQSLINSPSSQLLQVYVSIGQVFNSAGGTNLLSFVPELAQDSNFGAGFIDYVNNLPNVSNTMKQTIINEYRNSLQIENFWNDFLTFLGNQNYFDAQSDFAEVLAEITNYPRRTTVDAAMQRAATAVNNGNIFFGALLENEGTTRSLREFLQEYQNALADIYQRYPIRGTGARRRRNLAITQAQRHLAYRLFGTYVSTLDLGVEPEFLNYFETTTRDLTYTFQSIIGTIVNEHGTENLSCFLDEVSKDMSPAERRQKFSDELSINFLSPKVYSAVQNYVDNSANIDVTKTVGSNGMCFYTDSPLVYLSYDENQSRDQQFAADHSCSNDQQRTATGQDLLNAGDCSNRYVDAQTGRLLTAAELSSRAADQISYYDKTECNCPMCCANHRSNGVSLLQKIISFANERLSLQAKRQFQPIEDFFKTLNARNSVRRQIITFNNAQGINYKTREIRNMIANITDEMAISLQDAIETDPLYNDFNFQEHEYKQWAKMCYGYILATVQDIHGQQHRIVFTLDDVESLTDPAFWQRYRIEVDVTNPQILQAENLMIPPVTLSKRVNSAFEQHCVQNNISDYEDINNDVAIELAYKAITEFQDYTVNDNTRLQRTFLKMQYIPERRYDVDYDLKFSTSAAAEFYYTQSSKYTNIDRREKLYDDLTQKTEQEKKFQAKTGNDSYQELVNRFNARLSEIMKGGVSTDAERFSAIIYGNDTDENLKEGLQKVIPFSEMDSSAVIRAEENTNLKYAKTVYNNADEFKQVLQKTNVIVLGKKDKKTQLNVFRKLYKRGSQSDECMYVEKDSWLLQILREMNIYQYVVGETINISLDNGAVTSVVKVNPCALNTAEVINRIATPLLGLYTYEPGCNSNKLKPQTGKLVIGFEQQEFGGTFGDSVVMATRSMRERMSVYSDDSQKLSVGQIKNLWKSNVDADAEIRLVNGYDAVMRNIDYSIDDIVENVRSYGAALTKKLMGENCSLNDDAIAQAAEDYLINTSRQQGFTSGRNGCYGIVQAIFNGRTYFIPLLFPENTSRQIIVTQSKPHYDDIAGTISIYADGKVQLGHTSREGIKVVLSTLASKGMEISLMRGFTDRTRGQILDECIPALMDGGSEQRGSDYDSIISPYAFIEQASLGNRLCNATEETDLIALDAYIRQDRCYNPFATPMWNRIFRRLPQEKRNQYTQDIETIEHAIRESGTTNDWMSGSYSYETTNLFQDIMNGTLELSQTGNPAIDNAYNNAIRRVFRACDKHQVNPFYWLCTSTTEDIKNGHEKHSNFLYQAGELGILAAEVNDTSIFRNFFSFATATKEKPTGLVQPTFRENIRRPNTYEAWELLKRQPGNDDWYLVYNDFKVFVPFYDPTTGNIIRTYVGRLYGTLAQPSHDQYRVADSCNASKGPIRTICLGMANGINGCDRRLLMRTIQKTYQRPPHVEEDALEASVRQAAKEHPERYAIDHVAQLAPELMYISDYTKLRVQALSNVTKDLYNKLDIYSAKEENEYISSPEWWANEVAYWNASLADCLNEGEKLTLFDIRYIVRMALGKCNDINGKDKGTINEKQYKEVRQIVIDAIQNNRNGNFFTAFNVDGNYYGNDRTRPRYAMAYIDEGVARVFCRKFNTQADQNLENAVRQFLAEGREHTEVMIRNLDNINVNDSRHSVVILMNDFYDAIQLANGENPNTLFIAGFRLKDFCRMDYNIIQKYTEGLTQEQFEEMRQYAQTVRNGIIAMQHDAMNMDVFRSGQSQQFARANTRNIKLMEAKNTTAKLLKNAVRLEQAMALANPLVTAASFLDKGVSSNLMLYALRASEAEGLRGRLSPYTRNGIHLDDNFIESLSRDPRFTDMLDAIRLAKVNDCFNELISAIQQDPTLSPKQWMNEKFGVNASVFDRGFNLIAEFGSAGHTWRRARNEIFIRRLCDYLGEEGLSMFGQELHGMDGMNMMAYILQGRETGNPGLGLLEFFSSDFAIQTERAFNASLKPDWVQDNVVTVMFSHISRNRAWLPFLQATFGCTFFRASMNLSGRMLQHVLPMSSLHYLITRYIINTTNDEALAAELQTVQFAANLREALLLDMQHITAPLIVGMLLSYSGGIQPPDDEDKWGNFSEWTIFGLRIQNNWWLEDILGVWLPIACMWKASELGHPNSSLLYDGITQALGNNPALKLSGIMECLLDPDAALDDVEGEIQKYSDYPGGSPTGLEYLLGNLGACSLNVLGKFITPGLIKEIGTNLRDYEVSYNRIYTENVTGGLTTEAEDDGQTTYTTFNDAMIRKVTRNNPVLALIMNIIPNGATTGYSANEMPKTKYIDSAQYATMHKLSVNNEDGTPKSEEEQANLCTQIISILNDTEDLDGLYKQGFLLDSDTKKAVSQMLYELRAQAQEQYNQYTISTNGLDYYVLGDGDFQKGKVEATKYKDAFYDYKNQIQEVYNKLWSDELNQGIKYYNRYNTTYAQDAEGNYYATGFRKGLGGMLSPIKTADGSLYDNGETTGYENDWGTPSSLNGETMYDEAGNALRGLIGYEDKSYNDDKPSLDDFGDNNSSSSGSSYGSSYGSSSGSSSKPSTQKKSSGGSGGSSYQPTQQTRRSNLPSIYSRTGFSRDRTYGPDIDRLSPQYETKGSREAYRRQDF